MRRRSSGTWARPRRRRPGPPEPTGSPASRIRPPDAGRSPASASSSSLWPLPATPAMPTISPARTENETSRTRGAPLGPRTLKRSTASSSRPGRAGPFSTRSSTRRPTISSASSGMVVPAVSRWATIAPWRMTETRSVTAMISRSLWVIRMTVLPWAASRRRMRNRWSASCGVSAPVGSSRIRIPAPRYSAFRISTRCCRPTGRSPARASGGTSRAYSRASRASSRPARSVPEASSAPPSTPRITFSATVNVSTSMKCWWTMPMPAAMASWLPPMATGRPATRISPRSAR